MKKPCRKRGGGIKGLNIIIEGNNNTVEIEFPINFSKSLIKLKGNDNFFSIRTTNANIPSCSFHLIDAGVLKIGRNFTTMDSLFIVSRDNKKIEIGNNCLFSKNITIRNNDGHTITDKNTKKILNPSKDVYIGNNVWIGTNSVILKGAHISSNSVVGALSLVNKKFSEENIIIAGNPAKKIRGNILWYKDCYTRYSELNNC